MINNWLVFVIVDYVNIDIHSAIDINSILGD
jgi:hypothetical protein